MKKILLFTVRHIIRILPLAYMGLVWFLSSYPSDAVINTGLSFDVALKESMHLIEFSILYLLSVLALLSLGKLNQKSNFFLALFSVFYGLLDEFHQYFVPSRSCTIIDFLKDVTGVMVAWYIVRRAYTVPNSKVKLLFEWFETKVGQTTLKESASPGQHN
ncbi:MAG: VanZ family protein [Eubacteriales bacterium]